MLSNSEWALFEDTINSAFDSFATKNMQWIKGSSNLNRYGEDSENKPNPPIIIPILLNYNFFRTWPTTKTTETGEYDGQSVQVLIKKKFLVDNNYIDVNGVFIHNPSSDRFIIDSLQYKKSGDTPASQSLTNDLIYSIILERDIKQT